MIKELDIVALTHDLADHGLLVGDVGTVVHEYPSGTAFEVEFVTARGATVALLTLAAADVRALDGNEILHARELAPA